MIYLPDERKSFLTRHLRENNPPRVNLCRSTPLARHPGSTPGRDPVPWQSDDPPAE